MSAAGPHAAPRWEDPYRFMADLAWVLGLMTMVALATLTPWWPWG